MNAQNKKIIKSTGHNFKSNARDIMNSSKVKTPARKKKVMLDMWNEGIERAARLTQEPRVLSYYGIVTSKISSILDVNEFYNLIVEWADSLEKGEHIW